MATFIEYPKEKESDIQSAICEYLTLRNYCFWRVNTVGVFDKSKGVHRKLSPYARRGVADIFLLYQGQPIFIEVKTPDGTQSKFQKEFERDVEANGGMYFIARSVADVIEAGF